MSLTAEQIEQLEKGPVHMPNPTIQPIDFAGNSHKSKETPARKVTTMVVHGKVQKAKKSAGRKISETFLADDAHNVFGYIMKEVLIPAAKSTLSDLVSTGIDRLLYGGDAGIRKRHRGTSTVNYGQYRREPPNDKRYFAENTSYNQSSKTTVRRVRQSFEDIVMETREDAEEVLTNLVELVDVYGIATLADFYGLIGFDTSYVDNKHGWDTMNNVSIVRVRDGYVLNLARPIHL